MYLAIVSVIKDNAQIYGNAMIRNNAEVCDIYDDENMLINK